MTRSRLAVVVALSLAGVGSVVALGAFFLDPARASVGPLPAEALVLPADSSFVMGLDVKRFTASTLYQKYGHKGAAAHPQAFSELEEKTGINPERDLETVVVAGNKLTGQEDTGLVFVTGIFDRAKLGHVIESKEGVTWKKQGGTTLYLFREGARGGGAAAFLDDRTLVAGRQASVEAVIASHAQGGRGLRQNAALMVGDQTLLARMPRSMPAPGARPGDGASITLPALQSLTVTGDLEPDVAIQATGQAGDEAAAKNLADVVRGFAALVALQANQKPELKDMAKAITITTEASEVHINARFPYAMLEALQPAHPTVTPDPRSEK
jgi:hypothetical protein